MVEGVTGGHLIHLWRVSDVHLPRMADTFYDVAEVMKGATGGGAAFPWSDGGFPGSRAPVSGQVGNAWEGLRAEMQALLTHMGDVMVETAHGVRVATEVFNVVDEENGKTLLAGALERESESAGPDSLPPAPEGAGYPQRPAS